MAGTDKDTIYIDIDDEITGIIDKLKGTKGNLVALVLPKRATVFQSIVNMKLLKRAAEAEKKNIVLITSEAALLPLAGIAGVHVAKSLTSKPEIPLAPSAFDDSVDSINEEGNAIETPPDPKKSVGELATAPVVGADGVETLKLADDELPADKDDAAKKAAPKTFEPPKKKKNKKLKVPNFERFRLILILGVVVLILLIAGFIFANASLAKATIDIKTNANNVDANVTLNLSTTADSASSSNGTIPAKLVSQVKTLTAQEVTTGQKNEGATAQGSMTVSGGSCSATAPATIPTGTGFSSNGLTYLTQDTITFEPVLTSHGGQCTFQGMNSNGGTSIPITAQSPGASSNTSGTPFTDPGNSSVAGTGSATGGSDNIVQTVNQNDINNAKAKISSTNSYAQTLANQLQQEGYYPIKATYSSGTPVVTQSANVGAVANSVTVTEVITYTMFGAYQTDIDNLIGVNVDGQINTSKQSITDYGLDNATFTVNSQTSTSAQIALSTVAIAGPSLNISSIQQQVKGQKSGEIQTQLQTNPNVTGVTVKLSPFWVTTVPKNTSRITVNIAKPTTTVNASSNGNNP